MFGSVSEKKKFDDFIEVGIPNL